MCFFLIIYALRYGMLAMDHTVICLPLTRFIHIWNEPYLLLLRSRRASPYFGWYSFPIVLMVDGWVGLGDPRMVIRRWYVILHITSDVKASRPDWPRCQKFGLGRGLGLELLASASDSRHSGLGFKVLASASNQNLTSCSIFLLMYLLIIRYTQAFIIHFYKQHTHLTYLLMHVLRT